MPVFIIFCLSICVLLCVYVLLCSLPLTFNYLPLVIAHWRLFYSVLNFRDFSADLVGFSFFYLLFKGLLIAVVPNPGAQGPLPCLFSCCPCPSSFSLAEHTWSR